MPSQFITASVQTWVDLKKKQRAIKLKQGTCLKLYISLITKYTAKANNDFQKNEINFQTIQYLVKQFKIIRNKEIYDL